VFSCRKINVEIRTPLRTLEPQIIQKIRTSSLGKNYLILIKKRVYTAKIKEMDSKRGPKIRNFRN